MFERLKIAIRVHHEDKYIFVDHDSYVTETHFLSLRYSLICVEDSPYWGDNKIEILDAPYYYIKNNYTGETIFYDNKESLLDQMRDNDLCVYDVVTLYNKDTVLEIEESIMKIFNISLSDERARYSAEQVKL